MNPNCYSDVFCSEDSSSSQRGNFPSPSSSSAKKLKCDSQQQQQQEEDIISNLHDSILHHIFSFLDMKHGVQTCVLSKKWRYFWVSIPTLNFVYTPQSIPLSGEVQPLKNFTHFVDQVLRLRNSSNIHRFAITLRPAGHDDISDLITSNLDTWVLVAVLRNVEELSFNLFPHTTYWLPHCLFTCKSLTKLEIHCSQYGILDISSGFPDKISLPRLKTLYLDSISFRDNKCLSDGIISNCPNLESLILHQCSLAGEPFDICSLKLEELVFNNCGSSNIWFNINVPNLISFQYYDFFGSLTFHYEQKERYFLHLVHMLKQLRNVEDLKLSAPHLEFLTRAPHLLDSHSEFCNLRCLMLEDICISKDFNQAVSYLLKLSPNLETFGLTSCARRYIFDDCCWEAWFSSDSNCVMMNHLTVFELRNVKGRDCELKFIEVLLKNAKVLESLVIVFAYGRSPKEKESYISFQEMVLAFPRSSLSSTILFK